MRPLIVLLFFPMIIQCSFECPLVDKKTCFEVFPKVIGSYRFSEKLSPSGHGQRALYIHGSRQQATLIYTDFGDGHTQRRYEGLGGDFPHGTSQVFRGLGSDQQRSVVIMGGSFPQSGQWQRTLARREFAERALLENWKRKPGSERQFE